MDFQYVLREERLSDDTAGDVSLNQATGEEMTRLRRFPQGKRDEHGHRTTVANCYSARPGFPEYTFEGDPL